MKQKEKRSILIFANFILSPTKYTLQSIFNYNQQIKPQKDVPKIENIDIKKEELTDEELSDLEQENTDNEEDNDSHADESEPEQEDLQIIEGIKAGGKRKEKKKKEVTEDLQKKLELEEHNRFRNKYGIKVVGRHAPAALQNFAELTSRYNVSQELVDTIIKCGYTEPTPVQRQAIPCMLENRQILACAPTGSGKTAAFLLPILHSLGAPEGGPRALVLCPTRELAHQIFREALRLSAPTNLRCSVVRNMKESKVKEREATIRKSDIIISTPNRLCYLLNRDSVNITLEKISWLVIDEADKLFEGTTEQQSDFRQQLELVLAASGGRRRLALLSATHTPALARWGRRHMRGLLNITVGHRNAATDLVEQQLLFCGNEAGKLVAFRQLVQQGLKPPVLVFVQSKDRAKQLFKELIYDGINVEAIHAGRTQAQRDAVVRSFRLGRIWVLICTELMGRGIDFRGVNLVVNYDFPPSAISYIHRIGRAGRAGVKGRAVTFFTQDDIGNLRSIASVMKQSGCEVPQYMLQLKQNANKRKKLATKAPRRDQISTILAKPEKRKADENTGQPDQAKSTDTVKDSRSKKHRKIGNSPQELGKRKGHFNKKNVNNVDSSKKGDRRLAKKKKPMFSKNRKSA